MIKNFFKSDLINLPGWRTSRKIVVFESDDWGMVRMASKNAYDELLKKGYYVDRCSYNRYDALERNQDVLGLMEVLASVKDKNGNFAKFTLNNIVANPDFEKIKNDSFGHYYFETFLCTLNKYNCSDQVFNLIKEGKEKGVFQIQFHAREHLNINRWLHELQKGNKALHDALKEEMFTVVTGDTSSGRKDFLDAFGLAYKKEIESSESIISTGLEIFRNIWGFSSKSFIAPCYVWPTDIEPILFKNGIKYIQGTHVQQIPKEGLNLKLKRKYHYQGQKNSLGMRYLIRNVFFEPTENETDISEVEKAMWQIERAFKWNKPAIISSHRVNYIGRISPRNRDRNLELLTQLLNKITSRYPDVEFMGTDELGQIMDS